MDNNFFSTPLKPYKPASGQWPVEGLTDAFFRREFETAETETLTAFLRSGLDLLDQNGLVSLIPKGQEACDGDVRTDLIFTPSYAILAIGIYLLENRPSSVDGITEQKLQTLASRVFVNGLAGHGYGADRYRREILCMFALSGVKAFIENRPGFCPDMTAVLTEQLEKVKNRPEGEQNWTNPKDLTALSIRTLAAWEGNTEPVFVYGTLMQGQSAHGYMNGSTFAGRAILYGYAIYRIVRYPAIVPEKKEAVLGELYYVSKRMLAKMDEYENEGFLYERKTVPVETRYGKTEANAYLYLKEVSGKPINGGRWGSHDNDLVWYACYGSNLAEERFEDYIRGNEEPKYGSPKKGCTDRTLWLDSRLKEYPGQIYFGGSSQGWGNAGVAFYDPAREGKTAMRLYLVSFGQLLEIWEQEGTGYDDLYPLEITEDGIPVYTITSKNRKTVNPPSDQYRALIKESLISVYGMSEKAAEKYLRHAERQ